MTTTQIEQCVDDIINFIDSCKPKMFSQGEIIVNKDEIDDLLRTLQDAIPDDIKKYHNITKNQNEIINDARQKANQMILEAENMKKQLVNENELMHEAYIQANELIQRAEADAGDIINKAQYEANSIKLAAIKYADEMLKNLSILINNTVEESSVKFEEFIKSMKSYFDTINENRQELAPVAQEADVMEAIATLNELNNQKQN